MIKTFTKQPSERMDYDFDFADFLAAKGGDTITQAAVVGEPGLTLNSTFVVDGTFVKVFTSGGVTGQTYKLTCLAETLGGRIAELEMRIKVAET